MIDHGDAVHALRENDVSRRERPGFIAEPLHFFGVELGIAQLDIDAAGELERVTADTLLLRGADAFGSRDGLLGARGSSGSNHDDNS